jgi:hypothetical protein
MNRPAGEPRGPIALTLGQTQVYLPPQQHFVQSPAHAPHPQPHSADFAAQQHFVQSPAHAPHAQPHSATVVLAQQPLAAQFGQFSQPFAQSGQAPQPNSAQMSQQLHEPQSAAMDAPQQPLAAHFGQFSQPFAQSGQAPQPNSAQVSQQLHEPQSFADVEVVERVAATATNARARPQTTDRIVVRNMIVLLKIGCTWDRRHPV